MRNKTSLIGSGEVLRRAIEVVNGVSLSYLPIKLSISVIQSICPLLSLLVMQQILNGLQGSNATMRMPFCLPKSERCCCLHPQALRTGNGNLVGSSHRRVICIL